MAVYLFFSLLANRKVPISKQIRVSAVMAVKLMSGLNITTPPYSGVPAYTAALTRSRQYVMGIQRLKSINMPLELLTGIMAPERNICGITMKLTA